MKIVTIVGARPQFVKAAAVSKVLRTRHREFLVHTGQHYDFVMSEIFFKELSLPTPDLNLGTGSGEQGAQTGAMLQEIERVLIDQRPDALLVYGDTNSTLAGALAAAKLNIPIAHVEAGLRSFNRKMPEEINRVVTDHLSTWLFAPSEVSRANLEREGITSGVHIVGDIMLDAVHLFREHAAAKSGFPQSLGFGPDCYYLCTIHRAENTDCSQSLESIFKALNMLPRPAVLPLHPRTRKAMLLAGIVPGENVRIVEPVGYLDMLQLIQNATCILTDSGGIQKEAYYLGKPCVTLRAETEWVETVTEGWNIVAGTDPGSIINAVQRLSGVLPDRRPLYGDGRSAGRMVSLLESKGDRI
jgi:UDP-N-acetylglucosamine 2-epimerase